MTAENTPDQATIVLVHGAFAESTSRNGVIRRLHQQDYTVVAAANPIRRLSGDACDTSSARK